MAIILYSNAILENIRPEGTVFTEDEIINVFSEQYHTMHSKRIVEIPNSWAVWASMDNPPSNEYNLIGSDVVDFDIDSPLLLIHDSEINPEWQATDDVLQYGYDEFLQRVSSFINEVASEVMQEKSESENYDKTTMISLVQVGITPDKKLLFSFDPNNQDEGFYNGDAFKAFSEKIMEYLQKNFTDMLENKKPFTIFDDNKTLVIVDDVNVEPTLNVMMHKFQEAEDYEACGRLREIIKGWKTKDEPKVIDEPVKKKRGRPKKDDKK